MFTGIVAELGQVEAVESGPEGARLRVACSLAGELDPGDSVAVNGACLTATAVEDGGFAADVMRQTLEVTTLGELQPGDAVNLEAALRASDRLGGHLVQGHVDARVTVSALEPDGFSRRLRIELPMELRPYVVEHGSIAIEGVSLTVAALGEDWLEVSLIPETLARTTLAERAVGDPVNVECDLIGRYVQRMLAMSPLQTETER